MRWRLCDPLFLLDFYDSTGKPDHQKIMAAAVVAGVFWCQATGKPLDTATVIVLGAIGFGPRIFTIFLRGRFPAAGASREPEMRP